MSIPLVSIIIPAHNEGCVISRTLKSLDFHNSKYEYKYEIIVVCNACTDDSALKVKQFKHVRLIETDIASKTNALNLGDQVALGEVRVYMDADVVISADHIELLANQINDNGYLAVTPNIKMNYRYTSWMVRAYYNIWLQLPYVREGFMGSGAYVLSSEGRRRFDHFPDLISDDGFVRGQFSSQEISRIDNAYSIVVPPRSVSGLLKIKTRSRLGCYELSKNFPSLNLGDRNEGLRDVIWIFLKPTNLFKTIVYVSINLLCRFKANRIFFSNSDYVWETDRTSRT